MLVLTQFVLRMSFGLAAAMALTSPRLVTSGYFRNHAYVLLGLNVLATLVAWTPIAVSCCCGRRWSAAVLSYACSAVWLYERPRAGIVAAGGRSTHGGARAAGPV